MNEGLGFRLDSEFITEDPQFTLTCTSTGGPATTVTWSRGSETVEGDTVTTLINATSAEYTHTLTVTGRLGGEYTCNVSNSIPSHNNTSDRIKGKTHTLMCTHDVVHPLFHSCLSSQWSDSSPDWSH